MYANPVSFPAYFPGEEDHIYYGNAEIKAGAYGENPYQYMMGSFRRQLQYAEYLFGYLARLGICHKRFKRKGFSEL